jgi:DNA-binding CsgD family transcriptional regulator
LTLSAPRPAGWPSHPQLLALARRARVALDRRALCVVQHHIDDVPWPDDEALTLFLTLMQLAFATVSLEGEEEGMLVFDRAAVAARGIAWACAYVEAMKSRMYFAGGERIAARTHFEAAVDHILSVEPDMVCPEAWLAVADASIPFDLDFASDALRKSETTRAASYDEPMARTYRMAMRGRLAAARGAPEDAAMHHLMAWETMRAEGDVRNAVAIAVQLGQFNGNRAAWSYAREHASLCHPTWWPMRALAAENARNAHPLTPAQSDVLARIRAGASNKGIAAATGRSISRVRDIVAELFDIFAVQTRTRAALVAIADRYEPPNATAGGCLIRRLASSHRTLHSR